MPRRADSIADSIKAEAKASKLLKGRLSKRQSNQLTRLGYFEVIGGATGRTYRIYAFRTCAFDAERSHYHTLNSNNVMWVHKGKRMATFNCRPTDRFGMLPDSDVLLGQMLVLTCAEKQFLRTACSIDYRVEPNIGKIRQRGAFLPRRHWIITSAGELGIYMAVSALFGLSAALILYAIKIAWRMAFK